MCLLIHEGIPPLDEDTTTLQKHNKTIHCQLLTHNINEIAERFILVSESPETKHQNKSLALMGKQEIKDDLLYYFTLR